MSIFFLGAVRKFHKIDDLSLCSLCSLHNILYRIFAGFLPVFHRKFDSLTFAFPFFPKIFDFFNFRRQKCPPISSFPPISPLSGFFPVFRPPSRLFPQGSGGMLRQRQPPLLMRPLHCAFQPGDFHASDTLGTRLGRTAGRGRGRCLFPSGTLRFMPNHFRHRFIICKVPKRVGFFWGNIWRST